MTAITTHAHLALLSDRGVVSVSGEDATAFLDNLITNDMDLLKTQAALFAGLLSPQGKILFEFFVIKHDVIEHGGGYLLETRRDKAADLVKRLTMYKLRAKVTINDLTANYAVAAAWAGAAPVAPLSISFPDPRHGDLGARVLMAPTMAAKLDADLEPESRYHAHRIALGIAEGGRDYTLGDTFPHEANFDLVGGVSFTKGCYVGQEVVSRMQNKSVVRKRVVRVSGAALVSGAEVKLGDAVIGTLGSVDGQGGLALMRLDRAVEAADQGLTMTAGGPPITIDAAALKRYRQSVVDKPANVL